MPRHRPLDDEVKVANDFLGIVNVKRTKDIGYRALTVGRNIEITDTKKIVRRNGTTLVETGTHTAIYGTDAQNRQYIVKSGMLYDVDRNGVQTPVHSGLVGIIFVWDEDPNNNVYYVSDRSDSGIITQDGVWRPLVLPVPAIASVSVVDPGTWEARPFNLGKKYSDSAHVRMQVMATYIMADGRETAPSEVVSVPIAPEVRMLRFVIPVAGAGTRIYATAPGGSTYYLVGVTNNATVTVLVENINWTSSGVEYPYDISIDSFPADAYLICFFRGKLYAACYDAASGQGAIYYSLPLQYHLFNKADDFISVSSVPLLLLPHESGIIIGTSTNVYNWLPQKEEGGSQGTDLLTEIANYGVISGGCGDVTSDDKTAFFWTVHGVAKAMPYELVTEHTFSEDPGVFNAAKIFYDRGYAKLVASTVSGNSTFNRWVER